MRYQAMGHQWESYEWLWVTRYRCTICGIRGINFPLKLHNYLAGCHQIVPMWNRDLELTCDEIIIREIIE